MSYTNQTQHYGLPQYVATDIPAYLTDYNQAMATIDQGMNSAKTQAESAATAAGQAANDVAALQSTVNTQAAQISAAAQAASAAQTTANGADGKADTNTQAITGLDTRVTALEESGGGTEFESETLTLTGASYLTIPERTGKRPVFACVDQTNVTGAFPVIGYSTSLASHVVYIGTISATGCALKSGNHTVTVYYV